MPINQIEPISTDKLENGERFLDFLKSYYLAVWDSIRHKEDNIWRFISFVAVGLGALIGLSTRLTPEGYLVIIAPFLGIISFYGMYVVIDANLWFRRNLYIVNNCEKLLLRNLKSYILRTHFFRDPIRWETMYRIHFIFFYSFNIGALTIYVINAFNTNAQKFMNGYYVLYFLLMFLIHWFNNLKNQEYFNFIQGCEPLPVKNLEGKIIESSEFSIPRSYFISLTADFFDKNLIFELFLALPVIPIFIFYFIKDKFNTLNTWFLLILLAITLSGCWIKYKPAPTKKDKICCCICSGDYKACGNVCVHWRTVCYADYEGCACDAD